MERFPCLDRMNKLICLMGKSCTGKDTIYKRFLEDAGLGLERMIPYTTRPVRINEQSGAEYYFVTEDEYAAYRDAGEILEERAYNTAMGLWRYFTVADKAVMESDRNYLYIGTLEAYVNLRNLLGSDKVVPVYIEVDDSVRIERALHREKKQPEPNYTEMCRRFVADTEDFCEDNLLRAGIDARFKNEDLESCISRIREYIVQRI